MVVAGFLISTTIRIAQCGKVSGESGTITIASIAKTFVRAESLSSSLKLQLLPPAPEDNPILDRPVNSLEKSLWAPFGTPQDPKHPALFVDGND